MFKPFLTTFGLALGTCFSLLADPALGQDLETQMWNDMKHQNWSAVEKRLSNDFQSIHSFGALDRAKEMKLIQNLNLGSFIITDFKATESGDTIIVSYMITVHEKINDKELPAKPSPRLSVWKQTNGTWQWVAHANPVVVPAPKSNP